MKKIVIYCLVAIFMFSGIAIAGQKHHKGHDRYTYEQEERAVREWKKNHPEFKHDRKHPSRYHKWKGYKDRYRGHRKHHPEHYRGHWESWNEWEHYYKQHRNEFRWHRYYREDGSLYFRFNTDNGTFVFSIGR